MSLAVEFDAPAEPDAKVWMQRLGRYREASTLRSAVELAITAGPLAVAWTLMYVALHFGQVWLYALLILPTAGLLLRLFCIQHDCGHGSFLPRRQGNDWIGRVIGVLTLMPYDHWRRGHAIHHASSGNLDRRGIGDIDTLTVEEYLALPRMKRLGYRVYRHPVVMFGIGPAYYFVLKNRLPFGFMRKGWQPWISTMGTNVAVAVVAGFLIWLVGLGSFLMVHLPVVILAATAGVWLFYVQHQFEETHWSEGKEWSMHEAALHGSSHYVLPGVLRWFTANIGIHHVHHLSSRIPYYRLMEVLRDFPELQETSRLTIVESLRCVKLVLWDEKKQRLISFRELRNCYGRPALRVA